MDTPQVQINHIVSGNSIYVKLCFPLPQDKDNYTNKGSLSLPQLNDLVNEEPVINSSLYQQEALEQGQVAPGLQVSRVSRVSQVFQVSRGVPANTSSCKVPCVF